MKLIFLAKIRLMSLSIAIVGLPNVGKSTLFNALTKNNVLAANYPFATIDPNTGVVAVPDHRLNDLAEIFKPQKIVPATVTFVDVAGLVKGAAEGQGLGNQFLAHIRETDAICQVVRVFNDTNVTHVDGRIEPTEDIATINTELVLADMQSLHKRLAKLEAEAKKDPQASLRLKAAKQILEHLDQGQHASTSKIDPELIQEFQLLTAKPFIYVFNLSEDDLSNSQLQQKLEQSVSPAAAIFLCAKLEAELSELEDAEAKELLQGLGQHHSGLEQLAVVGYTTLGLQTYLTAGEKEVKAWTIRAGSTAPQAAGVIHTDFEKGFIRAETVNWQDLVSAGSWATARSHGQVRSEGRDYIMRDGDVVEFRFNV